MSLADWPFVLLGLMFLIASSAFFSGSETALMAVDRWRIRHLSRKGRRARLVEKMLKEPEKLIGTILLGNNLVNVAASALATSIAIKLVGEGGVIWSTLIMTLLILLFAEITPKTVAAYYPEQMSILIVQPIYVLIKLFYPIVRVLSAVSNKLIALLRLEKSGFEPILGIEEITSMIQVGAEEGVLKKRDEEMLQAVLTLDRIPVESVMLPMRDVVAFEIDTPYEEVMAGVKKSEFSRYPVFQERKSEVSGFVHIRDLLRWTGTPGQFSLKKIMRPASYVPEGKSLRQQLVDFQKSRLHLAFVVDEYGEVVGIVSLEDILEEIVGEIEDEHDRFIRRIQPQSDGSFLVDGSVSIRDLNKWLTWDLPEDGYQTIAGLVLTLFGRLPEMGEEVQWRTFRFRIEEMFEKAITQIRVIREQEPESPESQPFDQEA
ncbi:MAG: CNNM domain-containing protein [Syntrophobacteria bacterium]